MRGHHGNIQCSFCLSRLPPSKIICKAGAAFALIGLLACNLPAYTQSLDLQEKCASQARNMFAQMEKDDKAEFEPVLKTMASDYQSHYNTKLNCCLILIERQDITKATKGG